MPRDTDCICGCCEAQKAFVVCYECGKGDTKNVPLCKDCSSFIHRGLLSGHQVSSISRHNDRDLFERGSPGMPGHIQVKKESGYVESRSSSSNDRDLFERGSPGHSQMKKESGYVESRSSSSKGHSGSSYSNRNASSRNSSSKYGERDERRSLSQTRSNSNNYTDRSEPRSGSRYTERTDSRSVAQVASSSNHDELYLDNAGTYHESEISTNGFALNDLMQPSDYPDSRTHHDFNNRSEFSPKRDDVRDGVVSSTYPTHQPMPSLPNQERGRPGVYPLLPKVRYMDDEIFKVEVNSSLHPDGTFWAALVRTEQEEIEFARFEDDLRYSASSASSSDQLDPGSEVLANVKNTWCRAKVEHVIESGDFKIRQTDYGSSAKVHLSQLRNLPLKFYTVPYQALRCCIASKEVERFDRESQDLFLNMTERRTLVAQVIQCDTQNKTFYVKLLQSEDNGREQINISERVLQKAAISLGRAMQVAKAPDLRVTKYFSSESNKDDVLEVKVSGDPLESGNRKRPMASVAQRPKILRGAVMPKTDDQGQPRCFHCNHYGHFAKFCPRKSCRGWKRKK